MAHTRPIRVGIAVVGIAGLLATGAAAGAAPPGPPDDIPIPDAATPHLSTVRVADSDDLAALEAAGFDVFHDEHTTADGSIEVTVAHHPRMAEQLSALGAEVVDTQVGPTQGDTRRELVGRAGEVDRGSDHRGTRGRPDHAGGRDAPQVLPEDGTIRVLRADWFTNAQGTFLSVEVQSETGPEAVITVTPDTGEAFQLEPFVDVGVYLYHRVGVPEPLEGPPSSITVTADDGSEVTTAPTEWVDAEGEGYPAGYQWGFTDDGYVDPLQARQHIESLAAEFPDLAEIVDLPEDSAGYQKPAQGWIGSTFANGWFVRTHALGHEGGNGKAIEAVAPDAPDRPLQVSFDGTTVRVELATDSDGEVTSTANDVVAAVNASEAADVLTAYPLGSGEGTATEGSSEVTDGLDAPDSYPRGPFDIKALRIGATRDGSKTGVFVYSQEHAREWVTPLVSLEVAERLLRNYGSDPATTRLVDELDIFVIPTVNPDGAAFSLYDDMYKRKNLDDDCDPAVSNPLFDDSRYFVGWTGVDINRNFSVGSRLDGFVGASGDCASQVHSGPAELSEPEARNEKWLLDTYSNIRFAMNVHSFGGYFMWSPAAYRPDRTPLPRPDLGVESFFFDASRTILERIEEHRGTVVVPGRTGPVVDVLYSAAGNSGDEHYYDDAVSPDPEVFAWDFEVGADVYDAERDRWVSPGFFWPDFETEGFDQAMEFANGFLGMLEVAAEWQADDDAPTARPTPRGGAFHEDLTVVFETSEPATIHYTTDGSRPTTASPTLDAGALRSTTPVLRLDETTTVRWLAVDAAGNTGRVGTARYVVRPGR